MRAWSRLTVILLSLVAPAVAPAEARHTSPAVAFFYGRPVPIVELGHFDWAVVLPENVDARELSKLQASGVQAFAYLSLGEAAPGVERSWVLGTNPAWNSVVVNPAAAGWRNLILDRASALAESGYRGLFLDTLDSYLRVLHGGEARRAAGAALADLIRAIHRRNPELKLFFNRGFEILDEVGALASGLAAESLLYGWDANAKRYVEVSGDDRKWLAGQLQKVKERFGIPIVVVDYLPPARREAAQQAARRIAAMGFVPWISNAALDVLGVGSVEVIPRRMLLLYDGAETPSLQQSPIHRLATLPVEYFGCIAEYLDVRRGLPKEPLAGRYAGIVTWFTDDEMPDSLGYPQWLLEQIDAGVRVAIFGHLGFSASKSFLTRLGLEAPQSPPSRPLRIAGRDGLIGLEAEPEPRGRGLLGWRAAASEVNVHLRLEDASGQPTDPVITAPWGGMALEPYAVEVGYQDRARWIVDPFSFLEKALALGTIPVADLTTENGARLLVVVADSEGFSRPAGHSTAADVILRQVLGAPLPTTVVLPSDQPAFRQAVSVLPNVEPVSQLGGLLANGNLQDAGEPSLSELSPSGLPVGDTFQVYLPGWNESGVSSSWEARRFDPQHVIALIDRAESPRRLKPIGLYYHFSIATKSAALHSLKEVLRWAMDQAALPIWSSEYARRVLDFRSLSMARRLDGSWQFRDLGRLRTVRLPRASGWPDLSRSSGVAAVREVGEWRYVSFAPEGQPALALSEEPMEGAHLAWANAPLERWSSNGHSLFLRLKGHAPVRFAIAGADDCTLQAHGRWIRPARAAGLLTFSFAQADTGEARLECRRE